MSFEPKTSKEKYLATQAGLYDGDLPAPKTNEEYYLKEMAENPSSGGGVMYVECTEADEVKTLNKNFKEITDAVAAGMAVILHQNTIITAGGTDVPVDAYSPLSMVAILNGIYDVFFGFGGQAIDFAAYSETDSLMNPPAQPQSDHDGGNA